MDIKNIRDNIAFIITITGAIFSWWQAFRAKRFKEQIENEKILLIVRELISAANSSRDSIKRIKITNNEKQQRGFKKIIDDSINVIQLFIEKLNDNIHLFEDEIIENLFKSLKYQFSNYLSEEDTIKQESFRNDIYETINQIISYLQKIQDSKNIKKNK